MAPAPAAAATFDAAADTYVDASAPNTNYGTQTTLRTDNSPVIRSYLRFTLSGAVAGSAILQFYAETGSSRGVEVRAVADTTWGETTTTYANAPAVGALLASTGPFSAGTWHTLDVSAAVTGDGPVSFALVNLNDTAVRFTSRTGTTATRPHLVSPKPAPSGAFTISAVGGGTYRAESPNGQVFTGSLKSVGERAVADLNGSGGGRIDFTAGTFDFGSEFFKLDNVADIVFAGAGPGVTVIRNANSAAADTEPFNFTGAYRITVRDLTVEANGASRNTSDALDFDRGNESLVENVEVTASRGRGIVFDGKNEGWTSTGNTVRNCVITGVLSDGIELLASTHNLIENCRISDVGGHGIQLAKSSPFADQPNKESSDNTIRGNTIDQAGQDGVNLNGGDRNMITGNTITNSSDDTSGRDAIRISTGDNVSCDDNVVSGDTAFDTQMPKTQRYGLNIASSLCNRTLVGPDNLFTGNATGEVRDAGTGTVFR